MTSLDKINRYLYELSYKDRLNISNLTFEDLVEKLILMNEQERTKIINLLEPDTRKKIKEIQKGGII
jgi:hypothetical protein